MKPWFRRSIISSRDFLRPRPLLLSGTAVENFGDTFGGMPGRGQAICNSMTIRWMTIPSK